ncbi:MAG: hypothetical protein ACREHG_06920 [Candidatus Saccharimonadales bacterium]
MLLWCCGILPGLVYGLWRINTYHRVCRSCGSFTIVPLDSPRGRIMQRHFQHVEVDWETAAKSLDAK